MRAGDAVKRADAFAFARSELAGMRASAACLLERYARRGTSFYDHIQAVDDSLSAAESALVENEAIRVRPKSRYGGSRRV